MAVVEVLVLLQIFFCLALSTPSFKQQPQQKSALAGGDVTFYCVVQNLQSGRHVVQWNRGGSIITNNSEVLIPTSNPDSERMAVVADPSMGQYNLQISDVGQSDDLTYFCIVYDQVNNLEVIRSDNVRLEVHTVPSNEYPRCNPLEKPEYEEGGSITISCTSERANPPVSLQWYQGGKNIANTNLDDSQAGFRSLTHTFETRYTDDGAIFQCKMTTSAIGSFERSCSLGPLKVLYRPRVGLLLPEGQIEDGQQIRLECQADAKPEPFAHGWSSSIPLLDEEKDISQNGKILLLTVSSRLNGTKVSCNATNIQGTGMSNKVVIIVQPKGYMTTQDSKIDDERTPVLIEPPKHNGPDVPGSVSAPAPGLSSRLLLLIIGILSLMLIVLLLVLIFYTCRSYQTNGNHSIVYGAPSSICNGTNIDRAWDQTSVYFEPRDQISVGEAPTWLRTTKPPQWRRNVAVQVPFIEDPTYAEIEQDWDDGVYTLQI